MGRCEGSPDPSEVSSLGKLSVFSQSPIGILGTSFITDLGILPTARLFNSEGVYETKLMASQRQMIRKSGRDTKFGS